LEAAAIGVDVQPEDYVMRCNLLCVEDDKIKNHSAGHISTDEAHVLIGALNQEFADDQIHFYPGVSYRHIFVLKSGNPAVKLTPPHDVPGTPWRDVLPMATSSAADATAAMLCSLIERSQQVLENHPINQQRKAAGKDPANSIWFWSAGKRPEMQTYAQLYGKTGAVISAVDLLHGIGKYAGFRIIHVEGATGLYNTNYAGKVQAALEAIQTVDLVYLHIEAADEAGHEGNVALKVRCIEDLDSKVVKPIMEATAAMSEPVCIALLPDHPTPCAVRTHTHDPIPFVIYKPGNIADDVNKYDELSAVLGSYGLIKDMEFIKAVFE
jgi:2,3-bisphosphoglycerate-independent phosphoglycerate mutase